MQETRSTCPYCGVGCGVIIESDGAQITGLRGDPEHPANQGRLCSKGATLHLTARPVVLQTQRLLQPQRRPQRGDPLQALDWDTAQQQLADKLAAIVRAHGPDALGFYVSGQLLTEDYQAFNKLARAVVGTHNIDSNSRLCMSSAVVGYKKTLGADAPPACYEDIDAADCLFVAGANPAWAHPILFRRIEAARQQRPGQKLVVVDPRRTETAELAELHLQIQPGSDVALFQGMLHALIWEGWLDSAFIAEHTQGFEALKAQLREMSPARAARLCGIREEALLQAADWFARSGATLSLYSMGLNQSSSGTAKNMALIHLHLASGQIGRPGAGPFSLTGQPNAMGGRETGTMATLLPGHRDPADPADRAEIARLWGVPALPATPGKTAIEMFEAAARGEIKALWIACTNPAQSLPDQALVDAALRRCELVVLQEAFAGTATAAYADWLLPAASWGEKEGTVSNSERRISRVRAAVPPPGQARPDWQIVAEIGRRLEALLRPGQASQFADASPERLWLEHRAATVGRDLDIGGLSYALLDRQGPQQWPFPAGQLARRAGRRLYEDGVFAWPDGRARFVPLSYRAPAESTDARYPISLSTGRLRDQWHGMSRSGSVPRLAAAEPQPLLRLHPQTLQQRGLASGSLVRVTSRRGELVLPLLADANVAPAQAWLPMHWGPEFLGGRDAKGQVLRGVNALTQPACCPDSRQPELKLAAIAIRPAELPWRISAAAWVPESEGAALRARLQALMGELGYASCTPLPWPCQAMSDAPPGAEPWVGWLLDAAHGQCPDAALQQRLALALGLQGAARGDEGRAPGGSAVLRYADSRRGRCRLLRLQGEGSAARLQALLRIGEGSEGEWLTQLWRSAEPVAPYGRWLLSPVEPELAAAGRLPAAAQICNCFDVREDRIRACLAGQGGAPAERLAALQGALRCGTQCGSCLPALRRLVAETAGAAPAPSSSSSSSSSSSLEIPS